MNYKNLELANMMYTNKPDIFVDKSKMFVLKNEYKSHQCEAINEATKKAMSVIIPLELSIFVNKYLKLETLNNFTGLDNLYEKLEENEYM